MFASKDELLNGVAHIQASPADNGIIEAIYCRPATDQRQALTQAQLNCEVGLVGDNWLARGHWDKPGADALLDVQITLMNARAIQLIAKTKERWQLAGDQFFVDLDLSPQNLPIGTQLALGDAVIEITAEPHLGCNKFKQRFGQAAVMFVNTDIGKSLNARGVNAKVITPGTVAVGTTISKCTQ